MTEGYYHCRKFENQHESEIPTFGRPIDNNNGWVECRSKSFPGKKYYFNVDSRCRTWGRPVSLGVPTPIVEPVNLRSDDDFWDDASIDVSDLEDDEEQEEEGGFGIEIKTESADEKPAFISSKEAKRRKIFAEVLFKLYHCYGEDYNGNEIDEVTPAKDDAPFVCKSEMPDDDDANVNVPSILPEICYSSSSDGECHDEKSPRNPRRLNPFCSKKASSYRNDRQTMRNYHESSEDLKNWLKISYINCLRFGNLELEDKSRHPIDPPILRFRSPSTFYSDGDRTRRDSGLYSEDEEDAEEAGDTDENEDNEGTAKIKKEEIDGWNEEKNFPPRLKPIQFADLITRRKQLQPVEKKLPPPNRKARKRASIDETPEAPPPKKITKIIHEINGVKTINYDFLPPDLPPGVVASNLSDSGSSSVGMAYSLWDRSTRNDSQVDGKDKKDFILKDEPIDVKEPRLSESSSGSSSSSSDSDSSQSSSSTGSSSSSGSSVSSTLHRVKRERSEETPTERRRKILVKLSRTRKSSGEKWESCRSSSDDNRSWRISRSETDTDD